MVALPGTFKVVFSPLLSKDEARIAGLRFRVRGFFSLLPFGVWGSGLALRGFGADNSDNALVTRFRDRGLKTFERGSLENKTPFQDSKTAGSLGFRTAVSPTGVALGPVLGF